jgi:WD40 repeat protein
MTDLFISYSRRDGDYAKRLNNALQALGSDVWIDWEDIPKASDWLNEIYSGIDAANAFVLIVSEHSLKSEVCNYEISHAIRASKRIIPLIRQVITPEIESDIRATWAGKSWEAQAQENWTVIRHLNWIMVTDDNQFDADFQIIWQTLNEDLPHRRDHTRYYVRAIAWERQARNPSFLLIGDELRSAENWLNEAEEKQPPPDKLHREYIGISRQVENEREARLNQLTRRTRQFRRAVWALGVVGGLALLATAFAVARSSNAVAERERAEAQAQQAQTQVGEANVQIGIIGETLTPIQPTLNAAARQLAEAAATLTPVSSTLEAAARQLEEVGQTLTPVRPTLEAADFQLQLARQDITAAARIADRAEAQAQQAQLQITQANAAITRVSGELVSIGATLTPIPATLTAVAQLINDSQALNNSLLLASLARTEYDNSRSEVALLLAVRALNTAYTAEADSILTRSLVPLYTVRRYIPAEFQIYYAVQITNDLKTVYASTSDGIVRALDAQTGAELARFSHQGDDARLLAVTPDGRVLVTASRKTLRGWDTATQAELWSRALDDFPTALEISPNSERIAIGFEKGLVATYATDGTRIAENPRHTARVTDLDFTPNSQYVASTSLDGSLRVWIVNNMRQLSSFPASSAGYSVAFSPDGSHLAVGVQEGVLVYEVFRNTLVQRYVGHYDVISLDYSPDGKVLMTGSTNSSILLWDTVTQLPIDALEGHTFGMANVRYVGEDGNTLFSYEAYEARLHNLAEGGGLPDETRLNEPEETFLLALAANGTRVYGTLRELIVKSPDGRDDTRISLAPLRGRRYTLTISRAGDLAFLTTDNNAWLVHVGKRRIIPLGERNFNFGTAHAFTPDGNTLYFATPTQVRYINPEDGTTIREFPFVQQDLLLGTFTPDGRYIYAIQNGVLRRYDVISGAVTHSRGLEASSTYLGLTVSPNGEMVAFSDEENRVYIYNATLDQALMVLQHGELVTDLRFTPDNRHLITHRYGTRTFVWSLAEAKLIRQTQLNNDTIYALEPAYNNRQWWVLSADNRLTLWDIDYRDMVRKACLRAFRDLDEDERDLFNVDGSPTCPSL